MVIGEEEQDDLSGVENVDCESQLEMDQTVLSKQVPESLKGVTENQVRRLCDHLLPLGCC